MSDQFLGELRAFGFQFAPKNWAWCNGQTMAINQNAALFSLLGTTYGGNGVSTFQLPNLQSRVPMHFGQSPTGTVYNEGEIGGVGASERGLAGGYTATGDFSLNCDHCRR
jgi:microcystin-dependent protein